MTGFAWSNSSTTRRASPIGVYLFNQVSQERFHPHYGGEEKGLEALAQVKFFTPDSNWIWYASEFDGEDIFFGLVSGLGWKWGISSN